MGNTPLQDAVSRNHRDTVSYFINTIGMDPAQYDEVTLVM